MTKVLTLQAKSWEQLCFFQDPKVQCVDAHIDGTCWSMCLHLLSSLNAPVVFLWKPRGQLSTLGLCFIVKRGGDVPWELRNASWSLVYTKLQWRCGGAMSLQSESVVEI